MMSEHDLVDFFLKQLSSSLGTIERFGCVFNGPQAVLHKCFLVKFFLILRLEGENYFGFISIIGLILILYFNIHTNLMFQMYQISL